MNGPNRHRDKFHHARVRRLLIRYAYQFRSMWRQGLETALSGDLAQLEALCAGIDRRLTAEEKRRFCFTRIERVGNDLLVCWELLPPSRLPYSPRIFQGMLAEERTDNSHALPCSAERNPPASVLSRREGCMKFCG